MALTPADAQHLEQLRGATLAALREVMGNERHVVLLGTPRTRNLGDSLIWAGTRQYIRQLGHVLIHHTDMGRYRDSDATLFPRDAVVLLQGGGNLGDLYPAEASFRKHIVRTLGHHRIVVFPQSVHFTAPGSARETEMIFTAAPDLTVLLRDTWSLEWMRAHMPGVRTLICPDAAFGAEVPSFGPDPSGGLVTVARSDSEFAEEDAAFMGPDWSYRRANRIAWTGTMAVGRVYTRLPDALRSRSVGVVRRANARLLDLNMREARRQFAHARAVATNRLHAHVLACMTGIPNYVADNATRKISHVFDDYTHGFGTAHLVPSLAEAVRRASADSAVRQ